ncbi:MAG: hypothetical protein AB7Q17_07485 [Phycisphaerae bacterium]
MNADATPPTSRPSAARSPPPDAGDSAAGKPNAPPHGGEAARRAAALRTIALNAADAQALAAADRAQHLAQSASASGAVAPPREASAHSARTTHPGSLRDAAVALERVPPRGFSFDIFCLQCGYNLRGLAGDPIRCPECAFNNPMGDVEVPARLIQRQLARMEEAPLLCVLALPVGAVVGFVTATALLVRVGTPVSWQTTALPTALAAGGSAALIAFVYGAIRFRRSCLAQRGWFGALARYLFGAFLALGALLGAYYVTSKVGWSLLLGAFPRRTATTLHQLMMVGFCVAALLVVRFAIRPLYERWMRPIHALQRQVAVEVARRDSRRRLLKHRGRG